MLAAGVVPASVESALLELIRTAEAPEFKVIQRLIPVFDQDRESWGREFTAAVPQMPLPIPMRTQAGLPWNGPSTSSPFFRR